MKILHIVFLVLVLKSLVEAQFFGLAEREYSATPSGVSGKKFVIKERTNNDSWNTANWKFLSKTFKSIDKFTVQNYLSLNKTIAKVERKFATKDDYTILSQYDFERFFKRKSNLV